MAGKESGAPFQGIEELQQENEVLRDRVEQAEGENERLRRENEQPRRELKAAGRESKRGKPRRAVKLVRVLSRIILLSLAAAVFVRLTERYGRSVRTPLPDPVEQAERQHRPAAPAVSQCPEFIGFFGLFVLCAGIGRIGLRLRLSPASRSERQPISLNLQRRRQGEAS